MAIRCCRKVILHRRFRSKQPKGHHQKEEVPCCRHMSLAYGESAANSDEWAIITRRASCWSDAIHCFVHRQYVNASLSTASAQGLVLKIECTADARPITPRCQSMYSNTRFIGIILSRKHCTKLPGVTHFLLFRPPFINLDE